MEYKAVVVDGIDTFHIENRLLSDPGEGDVLIQVEIAGFCGTDLKLIRKGHRDLVLPRVPGEEVVGAVRAVGKGVKNVSPGSRVYVYPGIWCGRCRSCVRGYENMCKHMQIMGFQRDGGFAEYVMAPARSLIPVPDTLAPEQAVFAEPLSCCVNAVEKAGVASGMDVCILGGGPAGTLLARLTRSLGANVDVIEPLESRRVFNQGIASIPVGKVYDVCIPAVGTYEVYELARCHLAPGGVLVVFSGLHRMEQSFECNFNDLHYHEQTLTGTYGCSFRHGERAIDILRSGQVQVADMVTHRLGLDQIENAVDIVERKLGMKVMICPIMPGRNVQGD